MSPAEVDWQVVLCSDTADLKGLHDLHGDAWYDGQKKALQEFLCSYVNAQPQCAAKLHDSVSPVGVNKQGGKILKMRWAYPGQGKRGGLRLVLVAFCEEQRVVLAGAWMRKEDPTDDDVRQAAGAAS